MIRATRISVTALLFASLLPPSAAQATVEDDAVVLQHVRPQHIGIHELQQLLRQLHGRQLAFPDGRRTDNILLGPDSVILYEEKDRLEAILATIAELDTPRETTSTELEVAVYEPKNLDPDTLAMLATRLFGRQVPGTGGGGKPNISTAGGNVVVNDLPEMAATIRAKLAALDEAFAGSATAQPDYGTLEYRPKALGLQSLYSALQPFHRNLPLGPVRAGWSNDVVPNIAMMHEQGLLVIRDTAGNLASIQALLERIDEPSPQVVLSAFVLTGRDTDDGNAPEDLAKSLRSLLPHRSYHVEAAGLLRVAALPGKNFQLALTGPTATGDWQSTQYHISARISAFDPRVPSLTFDNLSASGSGPALNGQMFDTTTTIYGGEYAVLGIAGGQPVFVVLRMTTVEAPGSGKTN